MERSDASSASASTEGESISRRAQSRGKTDPIAYQHHIEVVAAQQLKPADAHRRTSREGIGRKRRTMGHGRERLTYCTGAVVDERRGEGMDLPEAAVVRRCKRG